MNIKLHTPKSLKAGSGMASLKQFLLSLLATTVSIALTFGTAAIIDYKKKQGEKREIVMMVMYDMYRSLKTVEKADSMIRQSMDYQRQIVEDTTQYDELHFRLVHLMPKADYNETTETIFSSSIETIHTVGNVIFTEDVAEFYKKRQSYKTMVCDSLKNEIYQRGAFSTLKGTIDVNYLFYAIINGGIRVDMQYLYARCKQMMEITDEEVDAYLRQREQIDKDKSGSAESADSVLQELLKQQEYIEEKKPKL